MSKKYVVRIVSAILVLLTCLTIFMFSNQKGNESGELSDKTLDVISSQIDIIEDSKYIINWGILIRKIAHIFEYFVLSCFVFIFLFTFDRNEYFLLAISIVFSLLYAISDEIHQLFVPGRAGLFTDVLIDLIGIILANLLCLIVYNLLIKRIKKEAR